YKYDKERNVAKINYKAGNILGENQSKLLNLLDGFTATNKVRSEYYYSFLYMGYFATIKINPLDHTLQYSLIETIEHPGYIAGKALFKNGIKRIDDSIVVSYGIDANEDEIFIIGG